MDQDQNTETIVISDEELKSLTDAIHQRHGIDFSCYEPKSLKRRITRALHIFNLNTIHELWIKVLKDHSFIYPFMDEISVGLTAMFRDPVLWTRMSSILKTDFTNKHELSVWHAGCSTGEEVYTMAIVLKESFLRPLCTHATDISNLAMDTARKGIYSNLKIDEYDLNYRMYNPSGSLKKYYKEYDKSFVMDADLIRHVTFEHHNLITGSFMRKYDIIFCRNVMIYFDNNAKRRLFDRFYDALNPNGLLVIGFYDAVLPLIDSFKFSVFDLDAKIFQKVSRSVL